MAGKSDTTTKIEIFRAGTHTSMAGDELSFAESDLRATAAAYDPAVHEAPLVVGHPRHDAPAWGWVQALSSDGGSLRAEVGQMDPAFAEAVEAGRYKKISAAFYPPNAKNNPAPGAYYLRHVGFLGAQPPAVRGLQPVAFADDGDELVTVEFAAGDEPSPARRLARALRSIKLILSQLRDKAIADAGEVKAGDAVAYPFSLDEIDQAASALEAQAPTAAFSEPAGDRDHKETTVTQDTTVTQGGNADDAAPAGDAPSAEALRRREQELAAREAAFAQAQAKAEAAAFVQQMVGEGKVPPGQADRLTAFMASLDDEAEAVAFAEGETTVKASRRQLFQDFLANLPKTVEFAELAGDDGETLDVADPEAVAREAVAFQEARRRDGVEISISQAVRQVSARHSKETGR